METLMCVQKNNKKSKAMFSILMAVACLTVFSNDLETAHWQRLIDNASNAGGGTVIVPAGRHVIGGLFLKSNVTLFLEKGCLLEGATNILDYADIPLRYVEVPEPWQAIVAAIGQTNVAIVGEGEIFGNGKSFPFGSRLGRPRGMIFYRCKNVRVEGISMRDLASWTMYFKESDGVAVRRVKVDSHANANNDGIDIDAKNVLVEECDFDADDDGIVLKSDNPDFLVENVEIRNCRVCSTCSAIKLGTASHGGFRNITVHGCTSEASAREWIDPKTGHGVISDYRVKTWPGSDYTPSVLSGIAVECVDGGLVENVVFRNITIARAATPIFIRAGLRRNRTFGDEEIPLAIPFGRSKVLRNVHIENFKCVATSFTASSITGVDGIRPSDITLRNIDIVVPGAGEAGKTELGKPVPELPNDYPEANMFDHRMLPAYGLFVRHVNNLRLENFRCRVSGLEFRPEIIKEDVGCEATASDCPDLDPKDYWDAGRLFAVPRWRSNPYAESEYPGMRAMLVEGVGPGNENAEFFAYYATPTNSMPQGGFPGMLLVHGGGGTAYPNYVMDFVKDGFAVLALDWYNQRPAPGLTNAAPSETSVPRIPLPGGKRQDHVSNVANIVLAHSLLRSFAEVNAERTVYVGLSWGSWYCSCVTAVDSRFKGACMIYLCDRRPDATADVRSSNFVRGPFHKSMRVPAWWIVWAQEDNGLPSTLQSGWNSCPSEIGRTIIHNLDHSHEGFAVQAVHRMARYFAGMDIRVPCLSLGHCDGATVSSQILDPGKGVATALLWYTLCPPLDISRCRENAKTEWRSIPAKIDGRLISATIPMGARIAYLSAYEAEQPDGKRRVNCGSSGFFHIDRR